MTNTHKPPIPDRSGFERYVGRIAIASFFQWSQSTDMEENIRDLTKLLTSANCMALEESDYSSSRATVMIMMNNFLHKLVTDHEEQEEDKVTEVLWKLLDALEQIHSMSYSKMPKGTQDQLGKIGEIALSAIQSVKR